MNREIKFRDYNPETGSLRYFDMDSYDKYEHDSYGNIMQFTGLKDKNGKEIYEGDILSPLQNSLHDNIGNSYVSFEEGCFVTIGERSIYEYLHYYTTYEHVEIIGNIHQNKYLLTNR